MHLAATKKEMLAALLTHGAQIDTPTATTGDTALHLASASGQTECVRLCLQHGADVTLTNNLGVTPFDVVKRRSPGRLRRLFRHSSAAALVHQAQMARMHEFCGHTNGPKEERAEQDGEGPESPQDLADPTESSHQGCGEGSLAECSPSDKASERRDTSSCVKTLGLPEQVASLLECGICLGMMENPVTLPCGHNFCKGCIESLIKHGAKRDPAHPHRPLFSCPLDRLRMPCNIPLRTSVTLKSIAALCVPCTPTAEAGRP